MQGSFVDTGLKGFFLQSARLFLARERFFLAIWCGLLLARKGGSAVKEGNESGWMKRGVRVVLVAISQLSGPVLRERNYLNDTPLLRTMGFLVSQHGQLGAIPPPLFLSVSPLESMRSKRCDSPPLKKGISAILARQPMKTRQMGAIPPSAIRKGIALMGGYLALGR